MYNKKKFKGTIEKIRRLIRQYNYEYYILNNPVISDSEYDILFESLKGIESRSLQEGKGGLSIHSVGFISDKKFSQIVHDHPMLSIENILDFEGLYNFYNKNQVTIRGIEYSCEPKIDGVAVSLRYEYGYLAYAATRGDGFIGEDITKNIKHIRSIPKIIASRNIPRLLEIRGEICVPRFALEKINEYMVSINNNIFVNARNAASGSLRKIGMRRDILKLLNFYAYSGIKILSKKVKCQLCRNQSEALKTIKYLGFQTVNCVGIGSTLNDCAIFYLDILNKRNNLLFDIDGTVFKMNSFNHQRIFGFSSRAPKWVIAYKFPPEEEVTSVRNIDLQTGRTGFVTPVAKLEPTFLSGAIIDSVSLHNFCELKKINIWVGSKVIIRRAGDVVPEIKNIARKQEEANKEIKKNCPSCFSKTRVSKNLVVRCIKNLYCRAQLRENINHFSSRKAMNISGLGNKIVNNLINAKILQDISDLFYLKVDDLYRVAQIGEKTAKNIIISIENSKSAELHRFLYSLGIKDVGITTSKSIAEKLGDLGSIINASYSDLLRIQDIGQSMAKNIRDFFSDKYNINIIEQLLEAGVFWPTTHP